MQNNIYWAGILFGIFYFPVAALFYIFSGKPLIYCSNRLYRALIILRHGDWYAMRMDNTLGYLEMGSNTKILEVGCGAGRFSKTLLEKGADLKAIDVNEKFISKLQNYRKGVFELCSITNLDCKDNQFDRVVMFDVLHHIPNYMDALSEIKRVLKPGGYAIIWEGSDSGGEEHVPLPLRRFLMQVLDGETNAVEWDKIGKKFEVEELEPYCYRLLN